MGRRHKRSFGTVPDRFVLFNEFLDSANIADYVLLKQKSNSKNAKTGSYDKDKPFNSEKLYCGLNLKHYYQCYLNTKGFFGKLNLRAHGRSFQI